MIDGIYTVEFGVAGDNGMGLIVLNGNKAHGGDPTYLYAGTYEFESEVIKASLKVEHWRGPLDSVFGPLRDFELVLNGHVSAEGFNGIGHIQGHQGLQMPFKGKKLRGLNG